LITKDMLCIIIIYNYSKKIEIFIPQTLSYLNFLIKVTIRILICLIDSNIKEYLFANLQQYKI